VPGQEDILLLDPLLQVAHSAAKTQVGKEQEKPKAKE
jgi:hypothetical protein